METFAVAGPAAYGRHPVPELFRPSVGGRAAMIADLSTRLAEDIDDGLVFPIETHLITWS
jgi:hypothetical protein